MALTLKGLSKNGRRAIYGGAAQSFQVPLGAFVGRMPPATIEVADGVFARPKAPKVKLTAEERKALRAERPKPTLAERAAAAQKRADALAAKAAAQAAEL